MSRHEDSFQIPLPPDQAKELCGQAVASLGWPITGDFGYGLASSESFNIGFTWPATTQVIVNYGDPGMSRITINTSNFGFGPIQSSHVRGKVSALRQRIEQMLQQGPQPPQQPPAQPPAQPQSPPQPSSARQVIVNGVWLRDDQINFLEQKYGTQLPNGEYWYDRMCGAWGMRGGPLLCTIEPNLEIGGPLQANASNGNTGVFMNGRELHYLDTALLQRVVPMILPGRWWVDVYGNFGTEGGPMLGNLLEYARNYSGSGGSRESVLSSWDRTGVAVFSS